MKETLTQTEAAKLLGVTQATVSDLLDRGKLEQGSDGRVTLESVQKRLTTPKDKGGRPPKIRKPSK